MRPKGGLSEPAIRSVTQDIIAEKTSARIKAEVRGNLTGNAPDLRCSRVAMLIL